MFVSAMALLQVTALPYYRLKELLFGDKLLKLFKQLNYLTDDYCLNVYMR